jgi:hypothetical protein
VDHNDPPGRSLVYVKFAAPCGIEFGCDCAMATNVQFDAMPEDGQQIAITCGQCMSVHWFTFRIRKVGGDG